MLIATRRDEVYPFCEAQNAAAWCQGPCDFNECLIVIAEINRTTQMLLILDRSLKGGNFLSWRGIKQSNTPPFVFTKIIALNCNSEAGDNSYIQTMQPVSKALRMEVEFLNVGSASCAETVTCSGFQPGGAHFDLSSMILNLGVPGKIMISELLILWPSTYSPSVLINMSNGKLPVFLCRKCLLDRELSQEYTRTTI